MINQNTCSTGHQATAGPLEAVSPRGHPHETAAARDAYRGHTPHPAANGMPAILAKPLGMRRRTRTCGCKPRAMSAGKVRGLRVVAGRWNHTSTLPSN